MGCPAAKMTLAKGWGLCGGGFDARLGMKVKTPIDRSIDEAKADIRRSA